METTIALAQTRAVICYYNGGPSSPEYYYYYATNGSDNTMFARKNVFCELRINLPIVAEIVNVQINSAGTE